MAGDFTLGCLLGQYDKAQSFDVSSDTSGNLNTKVGSWEMAGALTGAFVTESHSSEQGISFGFGASAGTQAMAAYSYNKDNDLYLRWFPDVSTHFIQADFWARMTTSTVSGRVDVDFQDVPGEISIRIGFSESLEHYRITAPTVTSHDTQPIIRYVYLDNSEETTLITDDVLTQIDLITLHPDWSFAERSEVIKSQNRTLGGKLHTYTWDKYFSWNVPLQFISTSHADLINWWWENQFNLLFTLDTSDSESMFTCRITNKTQPIGNRMRPYTDLWRGNITLESLDKGSPVF